MRRFVPLIVAICAIVPAFHSVGVHAEDATQQAAKEIADARQRANAAADAYFQAESKLDQLTVEEQGLETDVSDLQGQVDGLHARVEQIAVNRFTRSEVSSSPLLNGFSTPEEQMQVSALSAVITDTSQEDFDNFGVLTKALALKQQQLVDKRKEGEQQKATAAALRDEATAQVQQLKVVEAQRLQDKAVKQALAVEEAARAAKIVAASANKVVTSTTESPGFGADGEGVAPQTSVPRGGSGGQTGGGGAGGRPGGAGGSDFGGPNFFCPTGDSPVAFADTWGAPRSGGRRHEGTDMIGPIGTPIYAVVDGFAKPYVEELGGFTIWLTDPAGNKWYYGHLDHYGKLGDVKTGDLIAYMGQTGNARFSVPHLHFGLYPGGGSAVNPYSTLRAHC